jgi:hypothetical protein
MLLYIALCILLQSSATALAQDTGSGWPIPPSASPSSIFLPRVTRVSLKSTAGGGTDPNGGSVAVAALASGEIDYLTGYTNGNCRNGQGAPLKGIMISLRKPPFFLVADRTIQRPNDLAGKRIGVDRIGSLQHLVAVECSSRKGPIRKK